MTGRSDHREGPSGTAPIRVLRMVFPDQTNHHGTMFGGDALSVMTSAASHAAARQAAAAVVLVGMERTDFKAPIHEGDIAQADARVIRVGRTSIDVDVTLDGEELLTGRRLHAAEGRFSFVAVDSDGRPKEVESNAPKVIDLGSTWTTERIQPGQANHQGLLLGGELMRLLDATAFVAATRAVRRPIVTGRADAIELNPAVRVGDLVYLGAEVVERRQRFLAIETSVLVEQIGGEQMQPVTTGLFVMVQLV